MILVGCVVVLAATAGRRVTLEHRIALPTEGNAGFESFQIGSQHYIVTANFWDGASPNMQATSRLHRLDMVKRTLQVSDPIQEFVTKGAHGWDFFTTPKGLSVLVVCEYYGCGGNPAASADDCRSTSVFVWDGRSGMTQPGMTQHGAGRFVLAQRLPTQGPVQTDHYVRDGAAFMLIGENFADEVSVWKDVSTDPTTVQFEKQQAVGCHGAGGMAVAEIGGRLLLVAASYHHPETKFSTHTVVHEAGADGRFVEIQRLATQGCHDAEFMTFEGVHYLVLSEDRNDESSRTVSGVYTFEPDHEPFHGGTGLGTTGRFARHQSLSTDGAHAAELFEAEGFLWLVFANFGDRLGKRYHAKSSLWRLEREEASGIRSFREVVTVDTFGATDWEYIRMPGRGGSQQHRHYLAVANEGDVQNRRDQTSHVYELVLAKLPRKEEL